MGVAIVIPAYNESTKIAQVVSNLKSRGYGDIIIIDDCSSDNTSTVAKKAGATVLHHILNRGQGAALQTGIDYALQKGADTIVTFDADGQHSVDDLPAMLAPVLSGEVEITLGSRFLDNRSNVPKLKKLVLKGGVLFTYIFSGINLSDTHNGFRVFSKKAAESISISQDRMEHASEILDQIHKKKISFREVPVKIKYTQYSMSKGQSVANSVKIVFKLLLRKLTR